MSELRDVAVSYLARGWSVVPAHTPVTSPVGDVTCSCHKPTCSSPGKHPRVAWTQYQKVRASQGEVETWWTKWPDANIIVITGAISGVDVVDVDPRHGGDDSLHDLYLPETLTGLTGGGGQHLWYEHPGITFRNAAGVLPGIDFRGDGGYVIAPPSRHASGRLYMWEVSSPDEPAPFPDELRRALENRTAPVGDPGLPSSAQPFDLTTILARRIPHGERDDTLAQIAGHFAGQGDDLADVILKLQGVNVTYCVTQDKRVPDPLPFEEIERISRSIWEKEHRKREQAAQVEAALEARRNGGGHTEVPERDRVLLACEAWRLLGVENTQRWRLVLGTKDQYVLTADDEEAPLGDDLYNFRAIRKVILNRFEVELKCSLKEWLRQVKVLRGLAEVDHSEPTVQSERVAEWIESFSSLYPVKEVETKGRRVVLQDRAILYDGRLCLQVAALRKHLEHVFGERLTASDVCLALKAAGWERYGIRASETTISVWLGRRV